MVTERKNAANYRPQRSLHKRWLGQNFDLQVDVGFAPYGKPGQPIFLSNRGARPLPASGGKTLAVAPNSGPVILPRRVQGAIRTCELFRMRFDFPESLRVTM